jgi:hypothetical protein
MAQTKVKLIADGVIAQSNLNASHGITTADIGENASYLYYTDARVLNYLSTNGYDTATNIIASITDSAPSTLDTLNELAAALGDDANFSTTVTNSIATKLPLTGGTLTGGLTGTSANLTTSGTVLSLDRTGGATALVEFKIGGTVEGYLGANSTKSLIVFNESASEKLSVSNGGNLITTGSGTFAGNVTTNTAFIALGSLPALQASSIFIDSPTATINRLGVTGANTTTKGTFVISQYSSDGSLGADTVTIDSSGNSTFAGNVLITGTSDQGLRIKSGASALSYIDFSDADTGTPSGSIAYNNIVDAMTFGTGGSNTERMRITSAGNTQLSGNNLDIKGTSAGNTNIRITDSTGTVGTDSLDLINDGTAAYIWNRANTNILFGTNGTEKMRITSGGDVLIGTNGKFLQGKRNTGGVVIDMIGFGAGTDTLQIKGGTSGGANAISFYDTGGFLGTWYNGNFGIGTTSPGRKLTVTGDASGDANNLLLSNENDTDGDSASIGFSMLSNNTYVKAGIFFERTTTQGRGSLIFATNNEVNGNNVTLSDERMCIDSFGDVGIGTDDPYTGGTAGRRVLHINGTSSALMALGVGNALSYFYHDGSNLQITNLAAAGGDIILQNNGAERMRINSSGNVGIGRTTDTAKKLDVLGAGLRLMDTSNYSSITIGASGWQSNYPYQRLDTFNSDGSGYYWALGHRKTDGTKTIRMLVSDTSTRYVSVIDALYIQSFASNELGGSGNYPSFSTNVVLSNNGNSYINGGNLGIGTTSPQGKLDSVAPVADLTDFGRATGSALNIRIGNVIGYLGQINFCNDAAPAFGYGSIGMVMTSGSGVGLADMVFGTKSSGTAAVSTERMRITSDGYVLIGTPDVSISNDAGLRFDPSGEAFASIATTGYNAWHVYDFNTNNYRFYVSGTGQIFATNTSISAISDITLKENIKPLETGLDEVMKLQPRRFDWKNGDGENVAGFIAQEVEEVLPDLISDAKYTDEETKKSLKMGDMIPTLVKAIQELKAEIETLKTQING